MFADFRVHGLNMTFFQCFHHRLQSITAVTTGTFDRPCGVCVITRSGGVGRVPQVRQSVPGPKTMGRSPHDRICSIPANWALDTKSIQPGSSHADSLATLQIRTSSVCIGPVTTARPGSVNIFTSLRTPNSGR
jgi:hypothetical protein